MRAYLALFRARARTLFSYRAAAFAGLATQWVFGYIMCSVLIAFYAGSDAARPMTLAQTITYTWLGQAMLGILPWNIDREMGNAVRTGAIAYDLARPIDLYTHWFARGIAHRTAPTLLKCVPMFLIATFLMPAPLKMQWPAFPVLAAWALTTVGAVLLSCSITLFMQSTLFWTVTGDGVTRILPSISIIFSGMNIPLPLFPDWMQAFLKYQPFAGVMATPALLFSGATPSAEAIGLFGLQLFWAAAFVLAGRAILKTGLSRLTVAGG